MKILGTLLLPVILFAIGLVSLAGGVANYIHEEHFFATAAQATGTISEYSFIDNGRYCALIVFQDAEGQRQEHVNTSDCVSTKNAPGHLGQTATVYYDPADPSRTSQMRGLTQMEGSGLILGLAAFAIFAVTALGLFLVSVFASRRSAARAR